MTYLEASLEPHLPVGGPAQEPVQVAEALLAHQCQRRQSAEGVAAVSLHAGSATETALVRLAPGREEEVSLKCYPVPFIDANLVQLVSGKALPPFSHSLFLISITRK